MTLRLSAVRHRPLGARSAAPHRPPPPLAKTCHARVMHTHLFAETHYSVPTPAQPQAQFGFLAAGDCWIEPSHRPERRDSDHEDPATVIRLAHICIPFHVAQPLVDRSLGHPLTKTTSHHDHVWVRIQLLRRALKPATHDLAVTIHELNELDVRIMVHQVLESRVPCSGSREREAPIELDDVNLTASGNGKTIISGAGIDVDYGMTCPGH